MSASELVIAENCKKAGLSDDETKVYIAMVKIGARQASPKEVEAIMKESKIPAKGKFTSVLQQLVSKGYAKREVREKRSRYYLNEGKKLF
ncbi:MAG: helix-turn-helix domain-containing protein [Euryarchaeota archaeon]|nr:helix-turn-helix domain-containing protein [Euryarchaeota archaeon]